MNRMSEFKNGSFSVSSVFVLVCVTMPLMYASPTKPSRSVIVLSSASTGSVGIAAGPKTWNSPPRNGEPPGIGTGASDSAAAI